MNKKQFIDNFTGLIQQALRFNERKKRYGLSSLEEHLEDLDDEYFKHGMRMVVDGVEAAHIDEILSNILAYEEDKYTHRFKTIVKRTVLGIQEGLSSRILVFILLSMAGLQKDEQRAIEYIVLRDPSDEPDEPEIATERETTVVRYEFSSLRKWAIAVEKIEYQLGEKGVIFGNSSNREIALTDKCEDPGKVIEIITANDGTKVIELDLDID